MKAPRMSSLASNFQVINIAVEGWCVTPMLK